METILERQRATSIMAHQQIKKIKIKKKKIYNGFNTNFKLLYSLNRDGQLDQVAKIQSNQNNNRLLR